MKSKKWSFSYLCNFRNLLIAIPIVFFISCGDRMKDLATCTAIPKYGIKRTKDTLILDSQTKVLYSRLTKANTLGLTVNCDIPETKEDRELYVIVEGRARTNNASSNSGIAIHGANSKGEQLCWRFVALRYFYEDLNTWCHFKDSVHLKSDHQWKNYKIFSASANLAKTDSEIFDIDSLTITVKEVR